MTRANDVFVCTYKICYAAFAVGSVDIYAQIRVANINSVGEALGAIKYATCTIVIM